MTIQNLSIGVGWDGYDPRLAGVAVMWGELAFRTTDDDPTNPAVDVSVGRAGLRGWWEPALDITSTIHHPTGDGVLFGDRRLSARTIEIKGRITGRDFSHVLALKSLMSRQRDAVLKVVEHSVATEADVRIVDLRFEDISDSMSGYSLTLLADDPLRYGSVVPVVVNRAPNPWALPGGVEWGVSVASGHRTVLSHEPGPPSALRRTFTTSSSAETYVMPYDVNTTGVWVTPGAWLGVGAWMRRSDGEHVVGTISWRKPDGTFLSWAPFRYAKPLPFEWTWVSLAAQVPDGAGYARPAFGVRSAASVTPGSWFEVTGAVTAIGRLAPGPVGVV